MLEGSAEKVKALQDELYLRVGGSNVSDQELGEITELIKEFGYHSWLRGYDAGIEDCNG